ncbi:MAG TPA: hypothetical protein VFU97_10450, partial [Xanthobacteraceae bacterium]|nr:hypothetical protein [Xanthobacteraceae bacterium]
MADENDKLGLDPQPRRRVPPPTIDLEASHVSPADPAPQSGSETGAQAGAESSAETAAGSPPPEPPSPEPGAAEEAAGGPAPGDEPPPDPVRAERRPGRGLAAIGSAAAGAVLALIAAGAAWMVFGPNATNREQADALAARLSRVETQLAAVPKSAPATVDPKALASVESRVGAIENALAHPAPAPAPPPDPAIAELRRRLDETTTMARGAQQRADAAAKAAAASSKAATEAALAPASADAQAMAKDMTKDLAPRADVDALKTQLAQLESDHKALGDRLTKAETDEKALADRLAKAETRSESKAATESAAANAATSAATTATSAATRAGATAGDARAAVAALALARAVERGAPYSRELAAVDQSRADKGALDKLGALSSSGVPSAAALSRELAGLLPAVRAAAEPPAPEGGLMDRLKADAARLVRVRPIGAPEGNAPPEVLARLE